MAEKVKCEICDRTFKDSEGLAQHNAAKHASPQESKSPRKRISIGWVIFIGVILLLGAGIYWVIASTVEGVNYCKTVPVTEMNIGGHTNLKLHIHSDLRIIIDGREQPIPANIGILPGVMRALHTHDPDGKIHIEGPCPRDFTLEEFFQVWGRPFNAECIFDKCTDSGALRMMINGKQSTDFENHILRDGEKIVIEYVSVEVKEIGNVSG